MTSAIRIVLTVVAVLVQASLLSGDLAYQNLGGKVVLHARFPDLQAQAEVPPVIILHFPATDYGQQVFVELHMRNSESQEVCVNGDCKDLWIGEYMTRSGQYQWCAPYAERTDTPIVNHPDQWDNFSIRLPFGGSPQMPFASVKVDALRLTYYAHYLGGPKPDPCGSPSTDWSNPGSGIVHHTFINAWSGDNGEPNFPPPLDGKSKDGRDDIVIQSNQEEYADVEPKFPLNITTGSKYFKDHIRRVREITIEKLAFRAFHEATGLLPTKKKRFRVFPRSVREAAYDIGQSGVRKYSNSEAGACDVTQGFYMRNYTAGYTSDFLAQKNGKLWWWCPQGLPYCQVIKGVWPYSRGVLGIWPDSNRVLARVSFNANRTALRKPKFTPVSRSSDGRWAIERRATYSPKAGDMFWRHDRCWHGRGSRHAMILLAKPYFNNGKFMMPIIDGPHITLARIRAESSSFLRRKVDSTSFWKPRGAIVHPSLSKPFQKRKKRPFPVLEASSCYAPPDFVNPNIETGEIYCAVGPSGGAISDYCPKPASASGAYHQYEYYIGEAKRMSMFVMPQSPKKKFVKPQSRKKK